MPAGVVHLLLDMDAEHVGSPAPGAAELQSPDTAGRGVVEVGSTFMILGIEWTVMRAAKRTEILNGDPQT